MSLHRVYAGEVLVHADCIQFQCCVTSHSMPVLEGRVSHQCLLCAHSSRSDEHRSFFKADIPSWASSGCNGWIAVVPNMLGR